MPQAPLKLMIPGPVQPEDDVLEEFGAPVQPHYGPQWTSLYNETVDMMKTVFGTRGAVFLLVGSGSAAIDACIGSAVPTGGKMVCGTNGFFGERLKIIAENYGIETIPVVAEYGQPLDPQAIAAALRAHPDADLVGVCHVETSTTVVNPIQEIGEVVRRTGVPFLVDAVSSLGGLPVKMDEWAIDFCAAASQKCLGAPPGLGPVAVGPRGWEIIDRKPAKGHGWILNLSVWKWYAENWGDWHPHPSTMASSNVAALHASLQSLLREGIEPRLERYRRLALRLREGLRRLEMTPYTPDEMMAPVLTAAWGPKGVPTGQIVQYMADERGIKIAGGLGEQTKDKIIRIGHMAPTVSEANIDEVLAGLEAFVKERIQAA